MSKYIELAKQGRNKELNKQKNELRLIFPEIMDIVVKSISERGECHFRETGIGIPGYGIYRFYGKTEALAQMIEAEGFAVRRWWWCSASGDPSGIDITLE